MRYNSLALAAASASSSLAKVIEVADNLPTSPVTYFVPHLEGPKVLLADDVFRFLANQNTTGTGQVNETAYGFSMLLTDGKPNDAVPAHYVSSLDFRPQGRYHVGDKPLTIHSTRTGTKPSSP